ncbi:hypothetical protein [Amycolatopsis suaedae]|uniref:Uncharacterized protein n=1 Tax=Amycolatopsis suaedae TaxID=2510978 RepID=A0A4Q7IY10_9PSEU|nr:hypothetical protein [Amycolatopsis suaedae]RZQ59850.1 hypothetical protein EWH70_32575 [Amycolatopsis suaedae]
MTMATTTEFEPATVCFHDAHFTHRTCPCFAPTATPAAPVPDPRTPPGRRARELAAHIVTSYVDNEESMGAIAKRLKLTRWHVRNVLVAADVKLRPVVNQHTLHA